MPDPRLYQIGVLSLLLGYGALALGLDVRADRAALIAAAALVTQRYASSLAGEKRFDPRSALVTSLSLSLLLRAGSAETAVLAAVVAIGSKYALRVRGRHLFNPAAFGIASALVLCDDAWVSARQWGSAVWFALLVAGLGLFVTHRAARADVTAAFLGAHLALLFGRAAWLGDPLAIPVHAAQNGALLIFAFFMISDPRTTPASRGGRILHAAAVAVVAFALRHGLYEPNALMWALVSCAPLVPVLDHFLPGRAHRWPQETTHEPIPTLRRGLPGYGLAR